MNKTIIFECECGTIVFGKGSGIKYCQNCNKSYNVFMDIQEKKFTDYYEPDDGISCLPENGESYWSNKIILES